MITKQTLLVIGNGMVGQHFLVSLAASPVKEDYEIVTSCEEPRAAYDRGHLSAFFSGKTAHWLIGCCCVIQWYAEQTHSMKTKSSFLNFAN